MGFMKKFWIQSDCKISVSVHHWNLHTGKKDFALFLAQPIECKLFCTGHRTKPTSQTEVHDAQVQDVISNLVFGLDDRATAI